MALNYAKISFDFIKMEVRRLEELHTTIEGSLDNKKNAITQEYDKLEKEAKDAPMTDEVSCYLEYKYHELDNEFTNRVRSSFIVQGFTLLEVYLKKICDDLCFQKGLLFDLNDLNGNSTVLKAKNYLRKACDLDWNSFNPEWELIQNVRRLRNCIVHNTGGFEFIEDNKKLIRFINDNPSLIITRNSDKFASDVNEGLIKGNWKSVDVNTYQVYIKDLNLNHTFLTSIKEFYKKLVEKVQP